MGITKCSEKDCTIFRGMITACDACHRHVNASNSGKTGFGPAMGPAIPGVPRP